MERRDSSKTGLAIGSPGCHDERFERPRKLGELRNMVATSMALAFGRGCLVWLPIQPNILIVSTDSSSRLMPLPSIVTPATLSVAIDFPPPTFMNVPNVGFSSLNLAAPLVAWGPTASGEGKKPGIHYLYTGPSLTVKRITGAVAAQGSILPVPAPSVNSTWDLDFDGPSLHCSPVDSDFRRAALDNILNYTFARHSSTEEDRHLRIALLVPGMWPGIPTGRGLTNRWRTFCHS